tara:strand:+ start:183 stop:437 length:255 start_codon:yes stop_codon:yes gene_type:complete
MLRNYIKQIIKESQINDQRSKEKAYDLLRADLLECNWNDERISLLISLIEKSNVTEEELNILSNQALVDDFNELNHDEDLSDFN